MAIDRPGEKSNLPPISRDLSRSKVLTDTRAALDSVNQDAEVERLSTQAQNALKNIAGWIRGVPDMEVDRTREGTITRQEVVSFGTKKRFELTTIYTGLDGVRESIIFTADIEGTDSSPASISMRIGLPNRVERNEVERNEGVSRGLVGGLGAGIAIEDLLDDTLSKKTTAELKKCLDLTINSLLARIFRDHRPPETTSDTGNLFEYGVRRNGVANGVRYIDFYNMPYARVNGESGERTAAVPVVEKAYIQASHIRSENERKVGIQRLNLGEIFSDPELASYCAELIGDAKGREGERNLIYEIQGVNSKQQLYVSSHLMCTKQKDGTITLTCGRMQGGRFVADPTKRPDWLPESVRNAASFVPGQEQER